MSIVSAFPMTEVQKGIAYECNLNNEADLYISQMTLEVSYKDLNLYRDAWKNIINKYEVFKTSFYFGELEEDIQVVHNSSEFEWEVIEEPEENLGFHEKTERKIGFDINSPTLIRFKLLKTFDKNFLIITFHHIILDGWSLSLVLNKVDSIYHKLYNAEDIKIDNNEDYSNFIKNKLLRKSSNSKAFYHEKFSEFKGFNFPPLTNHRVKGYSEVEQKINVEFDLIDDYCKSKRVSQSSLFSAIWYLLLHAYTGENDILVYKTHSGRENYKSEDIVGLLIENYPNLVKINEGNSFSEFLSYNHKNDIEAREMQEFSINEVKQYLSNQGINESSNCGFVYENYPSKSNNLYEVRNTSEKQSNELVLSSGMKNNTIQLKLMYSNRLLNSDIAFKLLENFNILLEEVVSNEDKPIKLILNKIRSSKVVSEKTYYPKKTTILDLIEKNNEESLENNIAFYHNDDELTYGTLIKKTYKHIKQLEDLRLSFGETVAINSERTPEVICLMIALEKIGIPFVYLDSKNTLERNTFILKDSNVRYVFYDKHIPKYGTESKLKFIHIENKQSSNNYGNNEYISGNKRENYFQIIYTSGTTGNPKGIKITVDNILALSVNNGFYKVKEGEIFTQASSLAFDASFMEIWLPLLNNGIVAIIPDPVFDLNSWEYILEKYNVKFSWFTSSLFNVFVDLKPEFFSRIQNVFIGGEALSRTHIKKALNKNLSTKFYNGYGPTENTTFTTTYNIPDNYSGENAVPIGQLLSNSEAVVIDKNKNIVPIYSNGELLVRGSGLSRGYVENSEVNNEDFLVKINGLHYYNTGDIVNFDGNNFNYIDRKDSQIKINGYRVELLEIENRIKELRKVKDAKLIYDKKKQLTLYYTGDFSESEIMDEISRILPGYMVPNLIVSVDTMPLTMNGKIDAKRLVKLGDKNLKSYTESSEINNTIKKIVQKFTNSDNINHSDNFLTLGIDSMKMIRMNKELNKVFEVELPLKDFVQLRNIESLSRCYRELNQLNTKKLVDKKLGYASDVQRKMYYYQLNDPENTMYNIPYLRKVSKNEISVEEFIKKVHNEIENHDIFNALLTEDEEDNLVWITHQKNNKIDHIINPADFKRDNLIEFFNKTFDFQNNEDPLVKISIVEQETYFYFILVVHHIIFDGTSLQNFLSLLFNQETIGNSNNFFNYLDSRDTNNVDLEFWKEKVSNVNKYLKFYDNEFNHRGEMHYYEVPNELSKLITDFSKENNVSVFTVYLKMYGQLLLNFYNEENVFVGTPFSNRPIGYEDTLGLFVDFIPVLDTKDKKMNFRESIEAFNLKLFELYEQSDISTAEIQNMLPNNNYTTITQTSFSFQNIHEDYSEKYYDDLVMKNHKYSQFPISFTIYEFLNCSRLQVDFSRELFTKNEVDNLVNTFFNWAIKVLKDPQLNSSKLFQNYFEGTQSSSKSTDNEITYENLIQLVQENNYNIFISDEYLNELEENKIGNVVLYKKRSNNLAQNLTENTNEVINESNSFYYKDSEILTNLVGFKSNDMYYVQDSSGGAFKVIKEVLLDNSKSLIYQDDDLSESIYNDVKDEFQRVFKEKIISRDDSFIQLGGDSIKNIQLVSHLRAKNYKLSTKELLDHPSIELLTKHLQSKTKNIKVDSTKTQKEFKLFSMQDWYIKQKYKNVHHFNQSFFISTRFDGNKEQLKNRFKELYLFHPMLRAVIKKNGRDIVNWIKDDNDFQIDDYIIECEDIVALHEQAKIANHSLDIFNGPTSKLIYSIDRIENNVDIYFVCHHLFIDTFSLSVLSNEIRSIDFHNEDTIDISNTEELNEKIQNLDKIEIMDNQKNKLFSPNTGVCTRNISVKNIKIGVNLSKILASQIINKILKEYKICLSLAIEKNARNSETFIDYNLSRTLGWFTEIHELQLSSENSFEDVYLQLENEDSLMKSAPVEGQILLNIVNIDEINKDSIQFSMSEIESIDIENIPSMPPSINIIMQESNITVSTVNLHDNFLLESIDDFRNVINNFTYLSYLDNLKLIGNNLLSFSDYRSIISQENIEVVYPLFPLQEEMLYSSLGEQSESYINEFSWTTEDSLSSSILAINKLQKKYQALRTKFWISPSGNAFQLIKSTIIESPIRIIDLQHLDSFSYDEELQNIKMRYTKELRDYNNDSTHYFLMILSPEKELRITWLFNHILIDGWSLSIIINELWNKQDKLDDLAVSNKDYVHWLNKNKNAKEDLGNYDTFFSKYHSEHRKLFSNSDLIKSNQEINKEIQFKLKKELTDNIYNYAHENNIKVAQIFNYLWGYIVSKLSDASIAIFGLVDSGRDINVPGIESKVGLFIKTLPILFDRNDNGSVIDEINKLEKNKSIIGEYKNNMSALKNSLKIPNNEILYDTILVIENYPEVGSNQGVKDITASEQSNMPLSLSVGLSEDIVFKTVFTTSLFSEELAYNISEVLKSLLEQLCSSSNNLKVRDLEINNLIARDTVITDKYRSIEEVQPPLRSRENTAVITKQQETLEKEIISLWESTLNQPNISSTDDFFDLGGDSLKLSKIIFLLKEQHGVSMDVISFFQDPTIQNILNGINDKSNEVSNVENEFGKEDQLLSKNEEFLKVTNINEHILITGATGLLGSELTYQHLKNGYKVHTIVRSNSLREAQERIRKQLARISKEKEFLPLGNLFVYLGDISQEYLGMKRTEYYKLSNLCTIIYNSASNVNFMSSYKNAFSSNVDGIKNIMEFANKNILKKVIHVSTLSVVGHDHYLIEDLNEAPISYVKTKIKAELLLRKYRTIRDGVHVSRVGRLNGNTRTYNVPNTDLFWRLLVSVAQIGSSPNEFLNQETDLTPVDIVVNNLMEMSESTNENRVVNYFTKSMINFEECIEIIEKLINKPIRKVSLEEWLTEAEKVEQNSIKTLIPLFRENVFYEPEGETITNPYSEDKEYQISCNIDYKLNHETLYKYIYNALESEGLL